MKSHFRFTVIGDQLWLLCFSGYRRYISNIRAQKEKKEAEKPKQQQNTSETSESSQASTSTTSHEGCSQKNDPSVLYDVHTPEPEEVVELPIKRSISTHRICFLCQAPHNLVLVSFEARLQVFSRLQINIPPGKGEFFKSFEKNIKLSMFLNENIYRK